jgi:hypothetical protein
MVPAEISRVSGVNLNTVHQQLHKMLKDNEVVAVGRGKYGHPSKAHQFRED